MALIGEGMLAESRARPGTINFEIVAGIDSDPERAAHAAKHEP